MPQHQCLETFPEGFDTSQKLVVENWTWGCCLHCTCCDLLWLEQKKNQTSGAGECVTVINCGVEKVRDVLDTEEIKWKMVLSLCGMELQRALFAGWKLISGFCLKLSLCKRHVSVFQTLPPQLFASLFLKEAQVMIYLVTAQASSVGLAC